MKNLFLCLLVVGALLAGGIRGTLADFSDSEEEVGDKLQAGSLDLKVNDGDDFQILGFTVTPLIPDKTYEVTKNVRNVGTLDGWLYLHFKNAQTTETNDKDLNGDGSVNELDMPEPEMVAQLGGTVGGQTVGGLGLALDMQTHISCQLSFGANASSMEVVDLSSLDANGDGVVTLDEVECSQILIDVLPACGEYFFITFLFMLQDVPEEYYGLDYFDETNPHEAKWNWWPTNAYQGDTSTFDALFELLQTDYTPPGP